MPAQSRPSGPICTQVNPCPAAVGSDTWANLIDGSASEPVEKLMIFSTAGTPLTSFTELLIVSVYLVMPSSGWAGTTVTVATPSVPISCLTDDSNAASSPARRRMMFELLRVAAEISPLGRRMRKEIAESGLTFAAPSDGRALTTSGGASAPLDRPSVCFTQVPTPRPRSASTAIASTIATINTQRTRRAHG